MAKILLVDDEPNVLTVLSELLKEDEHDVTSLQSSAKAAKLIESGPDDFDLALFDVRMTPVDGMKLLKLAKEHRPNMQVIMLTAYFSKEIDLEAVMHGAYAYVGKPFKVHEILSTIESALAKKATAGEAKG